MQLKPSSRGSAAGRAWPARRAFTLLELLVVIGLIAVLTFVAVPAFKGFGQANSLAAAQRQIQDDLALARQLAIKHRVPVYLVFFSPDPTNANPRLRESATKVSSIHAALNGLGASDFKEHALRMFTNVFAGQHASYAFYSEGKIGDQPFLDFGTGKDANGSTDIRRGRYLTVGGSIWRTLPDGIVFAPGLHPRLNANVVTNLEVKAVPFPLAPDPGDPAQQFSDPTLFQLYLPAIAYDALGRSMRVTGSGQIDVTGAPRDHFVSIGIGSVFVPHDPTATNNFDFARLADAVITPAENYTNTIFRVTGLTGRARRFYWGNQP